MLKKQLFQFFCRSLELDFRKLSERTSKCNNMKSMKRSKCSNRDVVAVDVVVVVVVVVVVAVAVVVVAVVRGGSKDQRDATGLEALL